MAKPRNLKDKCDYCGCSEMEACDSGCEWVAPNVCSNCMEKDLYWNLGFEASKKAVVDEINELTWYRNDEGVKELEDNVDYVKVSELFSFLNPKKKEKDEEIKNT